MDEIDGDHWACDKCTYINENKDLTCIMCYTVRTATKDLPVTWQWQAADQWIPYDLPSCLQIESAFQSGKKSVHLTEGYFAQNRGYSVSFIKLTTPSTKSSSHRHRSQDDDEDDDGDDDNDDDDNSQADDAKQTQSTHNQVKYRFQQTNTDTGNVRRVRRLANDDDGMYILIDPSQLTSQEKCGVCAETLLGEDEDQDSINTSSTSTSASTSTSTSTSTSSLPSSTTKLSKSCSTSKSKSTSPTTSPSPSTSTPSDIVKLPKCAPGHSFHRTCIAQWLKLKDHCPFCQKRI